MTKANLCNIIVLQLKIRCRNAETRKELEIFAESLRFSDPVLCEAAKNLEITISEGLFELRGMITSDNSDKITAKIKEIKNLLNERNRICKAGK